MSINHFHNIYDFWFKNKKMWFDKKEEYDREICDNFFEEIQKNKEVNIDTLCHDKRTQIGAIIAYDQITRHYERLNIGTIDCLEYSKLAAEISIKYLEFLECIYNIDIQKNITIDEWCFILMPFRHLNDIEKIQNSALFMISKYQNAQKSDPLKNICKKFIYHSIKSIHANVTCKVINQQDKKCENLENVDNQWDMFRTLLEFCPDKKINYNISNYSNRNIVKEFLKEFKKIDVVNTNVIVSLSGGVDSCTCLYLLKYYYPNNNYTAVFINYNNRKESKTEYNFVKKYCNILGVKLFHRKVTEISRNDCHMHGLRDIYEMLTKDIRFDTYRQISNLNKDQNSIVLLGHNKDDCFENIITNISSKHNFDNLSGTMHMVTIDNINFWRPLLNVQKSEIIEFANNANIPYLIDSTPKWSTRGKIRDNVLKSMLDINPDIINSFFALKNYIIDNDHIIKNYILPNIMTKIEYNSNDISMKFKESEMIYVHNIWNTIFKTIFVNKSISYKSTKQFIDFLERFKNKLDKMRNDNVFNNRTKFILNNTISVNIYRDKNDNICLLFNNS